jgi:hypothetical protein
MQSKRQLKIGMIVLIAVFCAATVGAQESVPEMEDSASKPSRLQIYSETYSSPFSKAPVNFQRVSLDVVRFGNKVGNAASYKIFVAGERYSDESTVNSAAELGLYKTFSEHIFAVASARREYLNEESQSVWVGRTGLIFSEFFDLGIPHTFADTYGELFLRAPSGEPAGVTFSGWAKYGYRLISTDHLSFDPLIAMMRAFDSNDRTYIGADYQSMSFGPQFTYDMPKPELSLNVIAARAFTHSITAPDDIINNYWLLFAIGANF